MSITCTVCGTVNPEGTKFCEGCGVELTGAATASAPATPTATPVASAPATTTPETVAPAASLPVETPPLEPATPVGSTVSEVPAATGEAFSTKANAEANMAEVPAAQEQPLNSEVTPSAAPASESTAGEPLQSQTFTAAPSSAPTSTEVVHPTAPETAPTAAAASTGAARLGIKKFGAPTGDVIPLQGDHLVVGRFDASTGPVDIDLSGLAGQEHISRRHAEPWRWRHGAASPAPPLPPGRPPVAVATNGASCPSAAGGGALREAWPPLAPPRARAEGAELELAPSQPVNSSRRQICR